MRNEMMASLFWPGNGSFDSSPQESLLSALAARPELRGLFHIEHALP